MVPVYYCPGHPSNTISSGVLKFLVGFQKVKSESIEHHNFADPQGRSWRSVYQTQNNLDYLQIENFKFNPPRNRNIVVPTGWSLLKTISLILFISALVVSLFSG